MKTIIIYDTKHGFTKEVAEFVLKNEEDASLFHIQDANISLNEYVNVYIGSYILKGKLSKHTQNFIKKNKVDLLKKRLKLFLSALDASDFNNAVQNSLDPDIFYHAKKTNTGGKVVFDSLSYFEKRSLKKRINITSDTFNFNEQKILELIKDNK